MIESAITIMDQIILETDRFELRSVVAGDAPKIVDLLNHEEITGSTIGFPYPYTEKHAMDWIADVTSAANADKYAIFLVYSKDTGELVGGVGLNDIDRENKTAELGYSTRLGHWRKGIMTEAAYRIVQYGFEELILNRIWASTISTNYASARVMEKIGMKYEGMHLGEFIKNGEPVDMEHYAIIKSRYDEFDPNYELIVLETGRLLIREPRLDDVGEIVEPINDPEIHEFSAHIPHPFTENDAREWFRRQQITRTRWDHLNFVIILKDTGELVGSIWYRMDTYHKKAHIAYWVARKHWNTGIATEAAREIIRYGFEDLGLRRIEASIIIGNDASVRVLEKLGMKCEGKAMEEWRREGVKPLHCYHYSIIKPEWDELK